MKPVKPTDEQIKALDRTKIQLMRKPNTIFYTTIIFSMKHVWTEELPTMAVDGTHLFINPDFFMKMSEPERMGVLCHEALHIALNHLTRIGKRHDKVWNEAGDHVINLSLLEANYDLPDFALADAKYRNKHTEEVYADLFAEYEKMQMDMDTITIELGNDVIQPGDADKAQEVEAKIDNVINKAATMAKNEGGLPGNIPGELEILIDELQNPKLAWEVVLQNYMSRYAKEDYSYRRLNRRYLPDAYIPGAYSEAIADIATAVDCSGSITDAEFGHFISEHATIQQRLQPQKMSVLSFDTRIKSVQEVTPMTNILTDLKFHGRGGTDVREVFEWATENNPEVMIIFTDGYFNFPGEDQWPTCDLLWIIHDNPGWCAPVGETIHYEIQRDDE